LQLQEANSDLEKATEALHEHETSIRKKAETFEVQQADIDRGLLHITQAKTSDDAVKIFEPSMAKLRRLDVATGYLQLLQEVQSLKYTT
jgi:RAD50-interacting protein 1